MIKQPFYGEMYVEDTQLGKKSLYVHVGINDSDNVLIKLYNAPPPFKGKNLIGNFGSSWLLKKVKKRLLVTVFEITFMEGNETVKARCLTGHKFGGMLEEAISTQAIQ
jgi:hypothetical protein